MLYYLAREIFCDVGNELKRRRLNDDLFCIYAYATDGEQQLQQQLPDDPALVDSELEEKLRGNMEIAKEKLTQVLKCHDMKDLT